jgi:KDO2-lipid IV(A) lauroyltransferase
LTGSGETPKQRATVAGYQLLGWLTKVLPTTTGRVLFGWAGVACYHLIPSVRATVAANQARVLGRPTTDPLVLASTKDAFRRYGRYWFDAFHVVHWPDERVKAEFRWVGFENIEAAMQAGRGAICVLPHLGNWDVAGMAMALMGHPVVAVAESLEPPRLFELFEAHRRASKMDVIGLVADAKVGRELIRALRANRIVALVADRDLTGGGIEVEMFGAPRKMPAGPAVLALTSGAPLLVCEIRDEGGGWLCRVNPPLELPSTGDRKKDVEELTRRLAEGFERAISAAPSEWHMFQPAWGP